MDLRTSLLRLLHTSVPCPTAMCGGPQVSLVFILAVELV
jgi:hypothetical protein